MTMKDMPTNDTKTETISFRTWPLLKMRLEEYAASLDRTVGWLINEHLKQMLSDTDKMKIDTGEQ